MNSEQVLQTALMQHQAGRLAEAEALYRQVLAVNPQHPDALHLLGVIAIQTGHAQAAIDLISRAITEKDDYADFHSNLGEAYRALDRLDEAIPYYKRALAIQPDYPEAYNNLGLVLCSKDLWDEAIVCSRRALLLRPDYPEAHNNLGLALSSIGLWDEAIESFERALAVRPDYSDANNNLGNIFKDQGRVDEAIICYRRAIALAPAESMLHSSLLFTLHLHPGYTARAILAEHRQWAQSHELPRRRFLRPHSNAPDPDRRLKVGYVSPDLRQHPVGRILLPLFEHRDRQDFQINCYTNVGRSDTITERLRAYADHWCETANLRDEQLAEQIRADGIDILVDLSLHTAGNRLLVFALKPAPVQVTWLGYCSTTGLEAIDYRLTDPYQEPAGPSVEFYSEMPIILPATFWTYPVPEDAPAIIALPKSATDAITFGCMNNFFKVNEHVQTVWARLLRSLPNSRLVLHTQEGSHRERVRQALTEQGVDSSRLSFFGNVSLKEYFLSHSATDIALDTFPYPGGTTTCDALWMGVPVVSLVGQTAVGRGGLSILSNIGLPELVAHTEEEYVQIAKDLANDLPRLAQLRATMRQRMQHSPLMDAPRFARNIEDAYRAMWHTWCESKTKA